MTTSSENISLDQLKPGDRCIVVRLEKGNSRRRIMDIGIRPGSELEVERVAPFGDPVEFKLKGFHVSLRKEEAERIIVRLIDNSDLHRSVSY